MAIPKIQELLEAGVHFGARTSQWNPKMAPFIYGSRSHVHIIDLRQTLRNLIRAAKLLERIVAKGRKVVFIGTKRQAQEIVRSEAKRAGQFFVAERWLGGTLTNLRTIRERVKRLDELESLETTGKIREFSKKMISSIQREKRKIGRNFEGIRLMKELPGAMVFIDPKEEAIALAEAIKLDIPTIALADTDCDPDPLDIIIPGNDDSIRSIHVTVAALADACLAGSGQNLEARMLAERAGDIGPDTGIDATVGAVSFGGSDD